MTHAPPEDWPRRVGVLGVGLLGGSVALAVRRARPQATVVGWARSPERRQQLEASDIVHVTAETVAAVVAGCDVVVVASPVDRIAPLVIEAAEHCPDNCLITDVGSTKARIVGDVTSNPSESAKRAAAKFVAAHPIAGSEKSGAQHASADLFDGKVVILTPTDQTAAEPLQQTEQFWSLVGGVTTTMPPEQHDAHLAAISHMPHLVSALVAMMTPSDARSLVGSGWQDITRVAAGDPAMWAAICRENREAILCELQRVSIELDRLRGLIEHEKESELVEWLAKAKRIKEETQSAGS